MPIPKHFEDHCWRDVIAPSVLEIYTSYARETFVGPSPALIAIDLYEMVYQGGPKPVEEVSKQFRSSCGINAYNAIEPTKRIFAAARAAGLPIIYTTSDARPASRPHKVSATMRRKTTNEAKEAALYEIRPEFKPEPGDVIITKQRASGFFGTPLSAHLTELGVRSVIVVGESTSGCVRASVVDAYSHGFHVSVVEECVFDRSDISHKINLFDMHHKYADVMTADEVVAALARLQPGKAAAE